MKRTFIFLAALSFVLAAFTASAQIDPLTGTGVVNGHHIGPNADLTGADLSGADLSGADLSGADLSGAELRFANLRDADLSGANLSSANLRDANLSGANLSGAVLFRAKLQGASLFDADLQDASLVAADLSGAFLVGSNLQGANLSGASLIDANLAGTNLTGVRSGETAGSGSTRLPDGWEFRTFRGREQGVRGFLVGPGADFGFNDLSGIDLSDANLSGADFTDTGLIDADLSGADLSGANLTGADLSGADLSGANLTGATREDPVLDQKIAELEAQLAAVTAERDARPTLDQVADARVDSIVMAKDPVTGVVTLCFGLQKTEDFVTWEAFEGGTWSEAPNGEFKLTLPLGEAKKWLRLTMPE